MADYYPLISRAVAGLEKNSGEARRARLRARARRAARPVARRHAGAQRVRYHPRAARARRGDPQGRGRVGAAVRRPGARAAAEAARFRAAAVGGARAPAGARRRLPRRAAAAAAGSLAGARARVRPVASEPPSRAIAAAADRRRAPDAAPASATAAASAAAALRRMPGTRAERFDVRSAGCRRSRSPPPSRHPLRRPERRSLSDAGLQGFPQRRLRGERARRRVGARDEVGARRLCGGRRRRPRHRRPSSIAPSRNSIAPSRGCSSSTTCTSGRRTKISPSRCSSRRSRSTRRVRPRPRRGGPPPAPIEDEEEELEREEVRPRRSYGGMIKAAAAFAHRRRPGRRAGVAMAEHGGALPGVPRAVTEVVTRDPPQPTQKKTQDADRAAAAQPPEPALASRTGRGGRPEGRALRGGSGRSAGQALCRLGDVADRDGVAGSGAAARARDPRRCRGARAQARHDLVASPQHRQGAAGEPHRRDHVQAAGRFSVRRHLQCARHPDEAGRADPRRAARRARGQGHQRLLPDRPLGVDADRERNLQLLKERAWFDIPVVYNNNRRAILAMEKGTPGERVFAEAFKVWKQ